MKNTELIFKNSEEKEATEKVLATFKGKKINENIDTLVSEILNYAKKIDEILKSVDIESSYLDMVSNLNSTNEIVLKEDINDEKVKENVEDLIKSLGEDEMGYEKQEYFYSFRIDYTSTKEWN